VIRTLFLRLGLTAALALFVASPGAAQEAGDNSIVAEEPGNAPDNTIVPPPSEESLIFTGQDVKPLTPDNSGFSAQVDSVIDNAKAISSIMGPTTWAILILGFGLVGYALRRSERVLKFDTEKASRRTDPPEHRSAGSGPDASTHPHSDSDPAPSARRDQAE
jgi:hypothetical protein